MILDTSADVTPLSLDVLGGRDAFSGFLLGSPEANAIPDDHRKVQDFLIVKADGTPRATKVLFDLGPMTDFPA